jgi:putative ABC transport system permease protein
MLKTNLKLAFRNIFRNKLYTAINIIGLSVASAFCILVYLYVKNEQSFDSFHKDQAQLFRLEETDFNAGLLNEHPKKSFFSFMMKDAEEKNMIVTPPVLAIDLKRNFPDIEAAIRLMPVSDELVRVGNQNFSEKDDITYADEDFFKVFNFPLITGNPATALSTQNHIVISERLAEKYFGKGNPIGKVISFPNEKNLLFTVGGVAKNFPANSSLQFDMVIPMKSDPDYNERIANGLNTYSEPLILKLKAGTDVTKFRKKLDAFAVTYFKEEVKTAQSRDAKNKVPDVHLFLRPFADAHYNQSGSWGHYTDLKNIYQLICLTTIILFIACLNYILLTLTSTVSRSQDVGVRKTIGARRVQIILQYYIETQLLAFISVVIGLLIATACLPFFSQLTGAALQLSYFSAGEILSLLCILAILLGLVAGIYPAFAMSGLRPLNVLRSFSAFKLNPVLSKGLVVVQFTICVILIISSLVMNKQISYISTTSMGFDKDQVVVLQSPFQWSDKQKTLALKNQLSHFTTIDPSMQDMTSTSFSFGGGDRNGFLVNGQKVMLKALNVDYNYFSFNKIPITEGRAFSSDIAGDSSRMSIPELQKNQKASLTLRNIIVNQTLYNMLGKPQLNVINHDMGGIIIGVCKDYHNEDLTQKIAPAYHFINANNTRVFWLKIRAGQNIPEAMNKIKNNWNRLTGNLPFSYTFMDEEVAKSYNAYLRWMTTITTSCILAIIIACLGLFGLSGLTTINRTKEIGIRKVLGASVANLFLLLNRGTLILATGSFIIAAPIAFYLVHQWLDNFAYRIKPDWILFISAGTIAMLTAIIAVSYHTIKAAMDNPVKSLRSE